MMWAVACADGHTGWWETNDRDEAEAHARKLDNGCCACGGPHRVTVGDWVAEA